MNSLFFRLHFSANKYFEILFSIGSYYIVKNRIPINDNKVISSCPLSLNNKIYLNWAKIGYIYQIHIYNEINPNHECNLPSKTNNRYHLNCSLTRPKILWYPYHFVANPPTKNMHLLNEKLFMTFTTVISIRKSNLVFLDNVTIQYIK